MAVRIVATILIDILSPLHLTVSIAVGPSRMILAPGIRVATTLRIAAGITRNRAPSSSLLVVAPIIPAPVISPLSGGIPPSPVLPRFGTIPIDHPRIPNAARGDLGGAAVAGWRLLSGGATVDPHPALPGWRQMSRRNPLRLLGPAFPFALRQRHRRSHRQRNEHCRRYALCSHEPSKSVGSNEPQGECRRNGLRKSRLFGQRLRHTVTRSVSGVTEMGQCLGRSASTVVTLTGAPRRHRLVICRGAAHADIGRS